MTAQVELDRDLPLYRPGEIVSGAVEWSFEDTPLRAVVCLRWRAEGKGTPDAGAPITQPFTDLHAVDRRPFRLALPAMPYSFSGKVLAIEWRVEFLVRSRRAHDTVEAFRIVAMSPTGEPIDPYRR
jgi:hypothetical protein